MAGSLQKAAALRMRGCFCRLENNLTIDSERIYWIVANNALRYARGSSSHDEEQVGIPMPDTGKTEHRQRLREHFAVGEEASCSEEAKYRAPRDL